MAPGIPGIPNDVQGPAPDAPFRRSPRCSDTSDEPENLSYAKHSILSDKLLTAYTRHGVDAVVDRLSAAASTACSPSVSTTVRISTICRLPSSTPASLRRIRSMAAGSTQSLKGAPLRRAPGLRASTGT
jgi:hypothetical protein